MKKLLSVVLAVVTTLAMATGCAKLNDIKDMAEESDFSCKKENSKKFEKTNGKKKKKNNFKRYSFDLDYIFEINLNTYENFFC